MHQATTGSFYCEMPISMIFPIISFPFLAGPSGFHTISYSLSGIMNNIWQITASLRFQCFGAAEVTSQIFFFVFLKVTFALFFLLHK